MIAFKHEKIWNKGADLCQVEIITVGGGTFCPDGLPIAIQVARAWMQDVRFGLA